MSTPACTASNSSRWASCRVDRCPIGFARAGRAGERVGGMRTQIGLKSYDGGAPIDLHSIAHPGLSQSKRQAHLPAAEDHGWLGWGPCACALGGSPTPVHHPRAHLECALQEERDIVVQGMKLQYGAWRRLQLQCSLCHRFNREGRRRCAAAVAAAGRRRWRQAAQRREQLCRRWEVHTPCPAMPFRAVRHACGRGWWLGRPSGRGGGARPLKVQVRARSGFACLQVCFEA